MTKINPTCHCGKPIHDGAHLCGGCVDQMRTNLETIADRWTDLLDILANSNAGTSSEGGKSRHVHTGIDLNEAASKARREANDLTWFILQILRDDYEDTGRTFDPPPGDIDTTLRWIARWHLPHITAKGAEETALEIQQDIQRVERASHHALSPARWVDVNLACVEHGTSDIGERIPCDGTMRAKVGIETMPNLVCTSDPTHIVPPASWVRARYLHNRGLDETAARALVGRIVS